MSTEQARQETFDENVRLREVMAEQNQAIRELLSAIDGVKATGVFFGVAPKAQLNQAVRSAEAVMDKHDDYR